jgi:hypothetical protein
MWLAFKVKNAQKKRHKKVQKEKISEKFFNALIFSYNALIYFNNALNFHNALLYNTMALRSPYR